jgi:hypothetical protein
VASWSRLTVAPLCGCVWSGPVLMCEGFIVCALPGHDFWPLVVCTTCALAFPAAGLQDSCYASTQRVPDRCCWWSTQLCKHYSSVASVVTVHDVAEEGLRF